MDPYIALHTQINRYNYPSDTTNKNRALLATNEIQFQLSRLYDIGPEQKQF